MTEMEKLFAGLEYDFRTPEFDARKQNAIRKCRELNAARDTPGMQQKVAESFFGHVGENVNIHSPFNCDDGSNISLGDNFFANYNVTMLDRNRITIGDNCLIGPNCVLTTVSHAFDAEKRRNHICTAEPITIGDDVWLGANVVVLPGVTIGDRAIIGAGAVVTEDIPADCIAVGVPARAVRKNAPD